MSSAPGLDGRDAAGGAPAGGAATEPPPGTQLLPDAPLCAGMACVGAGCAGAGCAGTACAGGDGGTFGRVPTGGALGPAAIMRGIGLGLGPLGCHSSRSIDCCSRLTQRL
jgi:hypothetical protein